MFASCFEDELLDRFLVVVVDVLFERRTIEEMPRT